MIVPPQTIGILGGGQLGRMSAMAAKAMGYRVVVLTPEADSPCSQVCDAAIVAPYDDEAALESLVEQVDVVTYEFENVPAHAAAWLEERTIVRPSSRLLHTCRHRLREKQALNELGVPTAAFAPVDTKDDLAPAAQRLGFPAVLKTTTGGYDGKGQRIVSSMAALEQAYDELRPAASLILEAFVPFRRELSVIVARSARGECATFPVVENVHQANILHRSAAPAPIELEQARQAQELAVRIAEGLNLVGVMGVEMFAGDDFLYVNELAPRPHNSGHYTMDACVTSQFEQHIRAICNLPLGSTEQHHAAVMVNVLGQHVTPLLENIAGVLSHPRIKLHLYGKKDALPQRKMGHLTVLAPSVVEALRAADYIWHQLD